MKALLAALSLAVLLAACSSEGAEPKPSPAPSSTTQSKQANAATRALQRLRIAPSASNFATRPWDISLDGERIAFVGDGLHLYLAEAPAFQPRLLAEGSAAEPRWSPDGRIVAYVLENEGLRAAISAHPGATVPLSPAEDVWRTRIVRVLRWLDDETLAYEAHCGTGCQHLFEMTIRRGYDGSPADEGVASQIPFVRACNGCVTAGLAFHYSPDGRYVAADYGGTQSVAWYDRQSGEQWLIQFDGDASDIVREFHAWDHSGSGFRYRESTSTDVATAGAGVRWLCWHADPVTRTREAWPCGGLP